MNKVTKKVISVALASMLALSASSMTAFAASTNVDSIGSVIADYDADFDHQDETATGTDGIVGKDVTQDKESEYATYTEDYTATTEVYATQASTFSVCVPVVLVMDGASKTGDHKAEGTISVLGNIAGDEYIEVTPAESFKLSQTGKNDVTVTVAQDDTTFCTENALAKTGRAEDAANGITAIEAVEDIVDTVTTDFADTKTKITLTAPDARTAGDNGISAGTWSGSYQTTIALHTVA